MREQGNKLRIKEIETEVLVVGGGGAGVRAAIECASREVPCMLVSKGQITQTGITPLAQSALTAAIAHEDDGDSPEQHFKDIVLAGKFLSDQDLLEVLTEEAPACVEELASFGVRFKKENSRYFQARHPGHSSARTLLIKGGGWELMRALKKEMSKHGPFIHLFEDALVTRLFTKDRRITGAAVLDLRKGEIYLVCCKAVILAAGGSGRLWSLTDNPPESTGDGFHLAYHAGAELIDMELMLWYPGVICSPSSLRGTILPYEELLPSPRLQGKLVNVAGKEILDSEKVPPRDRVIALILEELRGGWGTENGGVYLDLVSGSQSREEVERALLEIMPEKYRYVKRGGIDLAEERVEVAPAAHFHLGGIDIGEEGQTSVRGLFAAGENSGNIHGTNRLSGNALTETQVFGKLAGISAAKYAHNHFLPAQEQELLKEEIEELNKYFKNKGVLHPRDIQDKIREIMGNYLGFYREADGLKQALSEFEWVREELFPQVAVPVLRSFNLGWKEMIEAKVMLENGQMVARAAQMRKETRGHHYRWDYPETDNRNWLKHTLVKKVKGSPAASSKPVKITKMPIPHEEGWDNSEKR